MGIVRRRAAAYAVTVKPALIISARTLVTALCLGLSLVFAGATSASVVDRAQHGAQIEHAHAFEISLSTAGVNHDVGHQTPLDHENDSDDAGGAIGQQPGSGHHHADAPAGVLGNVIAAEVPTTRGATVLPLGNSRSVWGINPGGPERPPKPSVQPV